jgi:glycosyltransferase involved in cell wall biosynthesis
MNTARRLRILQVDKFLHRQGGAPAYMLDLAEVQRRAGHEVEFFAMSDERNVPSANADLFVPSISLSPFPSGPVDRTRTLAHLVWSTDAKARFAAVIDRFQPDVVHIHNIYHQLSPSILWAARAKDVPVVMTVHDAKLVCASYMLDVDNKVCEACVGKATFVRAPLRRCRGGSLAATTALAFESTVHRLARLYRPIGAFICPSDFIAERFRRSAVFPDRLVRLPHFIDTDTIDPATGPGEGYVYAGRLHRIKGVDVLIRAVAAVPGARLRVLGDGPDRADFEALAEREAPGRVEFLGMADKATVLDEVRRSRAAVLPSYMQENMPMSILETFAAGRAMIVSDRGGSPEFVEDGTNGYVVAAGSVDELAGAIGRLEREPALAECMGASARRAACERYHPDEHLRNLLDVYSSVGVRTTEVQR